MFRHMPPHTAAQYKTPSPLLSTDRVEVGKRAAELHVEKPRGQSASHLSPDSGNGARSSRRFYTNVSWWKKVNLFGCFLGRNQQDEAQRKKNESWPHSVILEDQPVIRYFIYRELLDKSCWYECLLNPLHTRYPLTTELTSSVADN